MNTDSIRRAAVAAMFDVEVRTVDQWLHQTRTALREGQPLPSNAIPPPMIDGQDRATSTALLRQAGHVGRMSWDIAELAEWGRQTGRMLETGEPVRAMRTGRPPGIRETRPRQRQRRAA